MSRTPIVNSCVFDNVTVCGSKHWSSFFLILFFFFFSLLLRILSQWLSVYLFISSFSFVLKRAIVKSS